jgi:uncharacterized protein (AIM24 family)
LQLLSGDGKAFIHAIAGNSLKKLTNETICVDPGSIVAFTKGTDYDMEMVKGLKSTMLFSRLAG